MGKKILIRLLGRWRKVPAGRAAFGDLLSWAAEGSDAAKIDAAAIAYKRVGSIKRSLLRDGELAAGDVIELSDGMLFDVRLKCCDGKNP